MIKWGLQEEFSEEVGNSYLLCSCTVSSTDFLTCSSNQLFLYSRNQIKYSIPVSFSAIYYVPEYEFLIGATTGIPTLRIFSIINPTNIYLREFLLHQTLISQIYCSLSSNILITVGGKDIKIWKINMTKTSTYKFEISQISSLPGSPLCSNGMNLIYVDEKRHRIFVPHFNGFVLYSFEGAVLEKQLKFSHIMYSAIALLPSPRKYPGLDLSYYHFIDIFKRFAVVDNSANIHIYYKSGHLLLSIPPISSTSIFFISFVNSEFVITVNTNGEICLVNLKTAKVKIVEKIGHKPERVDFFTNPEPTLFVISGRQLYKYKVNILWRLFYRPVESAKSISRFCSPLYSARIGLLTSDGCVFMISSMTNMKNKKNAKKNKKLPIVKKDNKDSLLSDNYKNRFLVGAASTRDCPRPVSYTYNRDCNETNIIIAMDDSSVHLFDYMNDDWYFKEILPIKCKIILAFLGTELYNWCLCTCGIRGDVVFYKYGSWEKLSRISVGIKECDFAFWSKKDGMIVVFCQDRLYSIGTKNFNRLYYTQFAKPKCAAFEEGDLIVSYNHGVLYRYTVNSSEVINPIKCKFGHEITFLHLKYGCHIIVLNNNSIVVGNANDIALSSIDLPFGISSVSFLSSDLDVLVALDHEIMLIEKKKICPSLHPKNVPPDDLDNAKEEPLFNGKIAENLNEDKRDITKWLRSNFDDNDFDDDRPFRERPEEVLKRIRRKLIEDEENEFKFIPPSEEDLLLTSKTVPIRHINIIESRINALKKKEKERKPVQVIINEDLRKKYLAEKFTINPDGTRTYHYSYVYEHLRNQIEDFLIIEESFSFKRSEIASIVAETDEELDRIYGKKRRHKHRWLNEYAYSNYNSTIENDLYYIMKSKLKRRSRSTNNILSYLLQNQREARTNKLEHSLSLTDIIQFNYDRFNGQCCSINDNLIIYNSHTNDYYESENEDLIEDNIFFSLLSKSKRENDEFYFFNKRKFDKLDFASSSSSRLSAASASSAANESTKSISSIPPLSLNNIQNGTYFPASNLDNNIIKNEKSDRNSKTRKSFTSPSKKVFSSLISRRSSMRSSQDHNPYSSKNDSTVMDSSNSFDTVIEAFEREQRLSLKKPLSELLQNSSEQPSSALESSKSAESKEKSSSIRLSLNSIQEDLFNNPDYQYEQETKNKKNKNKSKNKNKNNQWKLLQNQQKQQKSNVVNKGYFNSNTKNQQQRSNRINNNDNELSSSFLKLLNNNDNNNADTKATSQNFSNFALDSGLGFKLDLNQQTDSSRTIHNSENDDHSISIKEPSYAPQNLNSSRRPKKNISYDDQTEFKTHHYQLFNMKEEEEEEEKVEVNAQKKTGRQLMINKEALSLFDPMNVPRILIHFDSTPRKQTKPEIKVKKSTQKRRIVIKRQQISREKSPYIQNSYYLNQ